MPATTLPQETRDAIVLRSVQEATGMLRHLAYTYRLELEDLQQEAALIALESLDRAMRAQNPRAYIHRAIRNQVFLTIRAKLALHIETIDTPYFADTLEGPVMVKDNLRRREQITRAVHDALHRLPTVEQELLADRHGLAAFTVKPGVPLQKTASKSDPTQRRRQGIVKLKHDRQLQAAIFA